MKLKKLHRLAKQYGCPLIGLVLIGLVAYDVVLDRQFAADRQEQCDTVGC